MTSATTISSNTEDWLLLSDEKLLAQCEVDTFRASGPGGQKRNKTSSAVRVRHLPSGLSSQAVESRSQHENRKRALLRLRWELMLSLRREIDLSSYQPSPQMVCFLRGEISRKQTIPYLEGYRELLDLLVAYRGSVSDVASLLDISTAAFVKRLLAEPAVQGAANRYRQQFALHPLRA